MSIRGNCWDNAVIESLHSSLKSEEFMYTRFNSISEKEVRQRIDRCMKYYNEERIQKNRLPRTKRIWWHGILIRVFYLCLIPLCQSIDTLNCFHTVKQIHYIIFFISIPSLHTYLKRAAFIPAILPVTNADVIL